MMTLGRMIIAGFSILGNRAKAVSMKSPTKIANRVVGLLVLAVVLLVEAYSVHVALEKNGCGFQDSALDFLFCNAFIIVMGLLVPIWAVLAPFGIILFGFAMPIASVRLIWSVMDNQNQERGFSFVLGTGLAIASYFYISSLLVFTAELLVDLWKHVAEMFTWFMSSII